MSATLRLVQRTSRLTSPLVQAHRTLATTSTQLAEASSDASKTNPFAHLNTRSNDTAAEYRQFMKSKPLNPHMTNTSSTIANDFPSVGADKPPADQLSSVDPSFVPKDSQPENTTRMTGGTQDGKTASGPNAELDVGEIEGGTFKVEPLRREGEQVRNMRARLLYQSRKRGTLESDLLLSHFANRYLERMTPSQLQQYDLFLDENDWDIYYWATQEPPPTSMETAEGAGPYLATKSARGAEAGKVQDEATSPSFNHKNVSPPSSSMKPTKPSQGEWAQTIGTFKPAYRPVPARWKNSEILAMLRHHVLENSAGGVHVPDDNVAPSVRGEGLSKSVQGTGGQGLGFMPELKPVTA